MRRSSLALALVLVFAVSVRGGDDGALVDRFFDIGRLTRPIEPVPCVPLGTGWVGEDVFESGSEGETKILFIDDLLEFVFIAVDPDGWDQPGVRWNLIGTRLHVRNHAKAVAEVEALLGALEARLDRALETRVRWMTFSADSAGRLRASGRLERAASGSLGADDVHALVAEARRAGNALDSGSASGVSGLRVAVRNLERVAFIEDYGVEIAQAARIADPHVASARAGLAVYVTPHIGVDDSTTLDVLASTGRLQHPMIKSAIEARTHGRIDLPRFDQTFVATHGRLTAGRTLAVPIVRPYGPSGPALGVLLVDARAAEAPPPRPDLAVIDLGYLIHPAPAVRFGWSRDAEEYERRIDAPKPMILEWDDEAVDHEEILTTLHDAAGREGRDPDVGGTMFVTTHGRLVVRMGAAGIARMRPTIAAWEKAHRRIDQIDVRVASVPRDTAAALLAGSDSKTARASFADASDVIERFGTSVGALPGRWAVVAAGVEQSYLRDYDVEVASDDSAVADPDPGRFFDGVALHARALPSIDASVTSVELDLRIEWADPASLTVPSRRGDPKLGILHQPRSRLLHLQQTVSVARGGRALIDGGSDPLTADGSRRLIIAVGIR